jgi:pimeloyl-ACP methyl ester carboxylesterase
LRSTGRDPQNFEISQQSRDAVAVLRAVGETAAFVFGNSGGAVIALDMAKTQPQAVRAAVVHEPPVLRVLPDGEKWRRFFASLYRMAFSRLAFGFGVQLAMFRIALSVGVPCRAYAKVPKDLGTRLGKNHDFLVKHEMLPFSNYKPDVEVIKKNGVKVFMAAGKRTLDAGKYCGRTPPILADLLGCEMVTFPGHHMSYLEMPEAWAAALRAVLKRGENRGHPRCPA